MNDWNIELIIAAIGALAAVAAAVFAWPTMAEWRSKRVLSKSFGSDMYDPDEIWQSTRYYIHPDSSNIDPAGEAEIKNVRAPKEPIFDAIDDFLAKDSRYRHMLILADSGMGKTSCLINYYAQNQKRRSVRHRIALISLGRPDADKYIEEIDQQNQTVLFLDSFDEDTSAIDDYQSRLETLIEMSRNFKRVIITCRTQFFMSDEEIPREVGIIRVSPVNAQTKEYEFLKVYLLPFSDQQVNLFLHKRFPIWKWRTRRKARKIARTIPLLSVRPMLLSNIPDLIAENVNIQYSVELYEALILGWLERESYWVEPEQLHRFSEKLAVDFWTKREIRGMERMSSSELSEMARQWNIPLEQWQLSNRSLLNRDAVGNYKFAHRSIMEYLYVYYNLTNDTIWSDVGLTDQMEFFLAEMLFVRSSNQTEINLRSLDLSFFRKNNIPRNVFRGANLGGANLGKLQFLYSMNLEFAKYDRDTIWPLDYKYQNSGAIGPEANLRNKKIDGLDFSGIDLYQTDLIGSQLNGSKFSGVDLSETFLSGADLSEADLSNCNLSNCCIAGSEFSHSNLHSANLERANLLFSNMQNAVLDNSNLGNGYLYKACLTEAQLTSATLINANLRGANFNQANLENADLSNTDLCGADLTGATLDGAILTSALYDDNTRWPQTLDSLSELIIGTPTFMPTQDTGSVVSIKSEQWRSNTLMEDYRIEYPGDLVVERIILAKDTPIRTLKVHVLTSMIFQAPRCIWFRFWMFNDDVIIDQYYTEAGKLIGTYIAPCLSMEPSKSDGSCTAIVLVTGVWRNTDGHIYIVDRQELYEQLDGDEIGMDYGIIELETPVRKVVKSMSIGNLPPALIRNFTVTVS